MEKQRGRAWTITEWLEAIPGEKPTYSQVHNWLGKKYLAGEIRYQGRSPYWVILVEPVRENIPKVRRGRKTPTGRS